MALIHCTFCKRSVVQLLDIDVCMNCLQLENDAIRIYAIKQYLEKNPDAKFKEVKEALNIDQQTMDRFLREGSIELVGKSDIEKVEREERAKKIENLRKQMSSNGLYNNLATKTNAGPRNYYSYGSQLVKDLNEKRNRNSQDDLSR